MIRALLAAAMLAAVPAQEGPSPQEQFERRKEAAIWRAKDWLLTRAKGGLPSLAADAGRQEELALYALLHCGVDPNHGAIAALLEAVLKAPVDRTYNAALGAMALEALDRAKYRDRIAEYAQVLVDQQCANGQWAYGTPARFKPEIAPSDPREPGATKTAILIRRKDKGPARGDNSNSQYAALGLRAVAAAGIEVPKETLQLGLDWWERSQRGDGSWDYGSEEIKDPSGYGSMTAGGAASCVIYRSLLKSDWSKDARVKKAVDWIASNFTVTANPKYRSPDVWVLYWLYAVERVGGLMSLASIGKHDWYVEGAQRLIDTQEKDGGWDTKREMPVADTCFAILFLRKATRPAPSVASRVEK